MAAKDEGDPEQGKADESTGLINAAAANRRVEMPHIQGECPEARAHVG